MMKKKILVVEDERIVAEDIKGILENLGYGISGIATSGEEAVKKAKKAHPDLVLMDIVLEGNMNGIDAADQIYSRLDIPVVYLTAYADDVNLQRAKITEPFGYILKPFGESELHTVIETALYKHEMEKTLRESEEKYRGLTETATDIIFTLDKEGKCTYLNPAGEKTVGYSTKDWIGRSFTEILAPEYIESTIDRFRRGLSGETIPIYEIEIAHKDGKKIPVEVNVTSLLDAKGKTTGRIGIARDITTRKQTEEALKESEQRSADIINFLPDATFAINLEGKVVTWNRAIEEMTGVKAKDMVGKGNYEYAIPFYNTRRPVLIDLVFKPDEEIEKKYSFISKEKNCLIVETDVPFVKGQDLFLWAKASPIFDHRGNVVGAIESIRDITERKRTEKKLEKSYKRLQAALDGTVNALAATVEMRDPYTAGHQRRVAQLACAIAEEMNLPEERIRDLHTAAVIHDIGKINVPSEILSKPGRLSEIEFDMVKSHPQVGYDILQKTRCPEAVTQIVLQHQERLDGSGYHQGLSGEDIILEARILAVADVVEAMCSHRPYRAAFGIDRALEEISQNKGILYDAEAVDACVTLFKEERFAFEEEWENHD